MPPNARTVFLFLVLCGLASCRKDLLHWQLTAQLDTHGAHRLNNIRFVNDTLGFVVGGERFYHTDILITRDGGFTWRLEDHPEAGKELFGLTVSPSGGIYTVGYDGKLLWSLDGGSNWSFKQITYNPYKGIAFSGPGKALVVGGISFETGFTEQIDSLGHTGSLKELDYELNDIVLLAGGIGYCSGYGVMLKTADSGKTWQLQDLVNDNFTALDVHNADLVWTCGYNGSVYKTTDGGAHWSCQRSGNDINKPRYHLQDILFIDDLHGYAVGENGLVIYSDDGGDHWMELDRFTSEHLRSIARCPNGDLLVCGDNGAMYRLLQR